MVESTLKYVNKNFLNIPVCILSTTGTVKTKVYHNHLLAKNINFVYPTNEEQDIIMSVINDTKKGVDRTILTNRIVDIVKDILSRNSDIIFVLACTELSLYSKEISKISKTVDAMDCLIDCIFDKCGYKQK